MTEFSFDRDAVEASLFNFQRVGDGPTKLFGNDFVNGAMGALFNAERLAAAAGVVPTVKIDGEDAVVGIGQAREKIDSADPTVRILYLSTSALVRQTHASAVRVQEPASSDSGDLGLAQVAVVIIVLGVAAIIATAGYFVAREAIQVAGKSLRAIAAASDMAKLAEEQLRTTGKIDPAIVQALRDPSVTAAAEEEAAKTSGLGKIALIGGGLLAAGGGLYFAHRKGWL